MYILWVYIICCRLSTIIFQIILSLSFSTDNYSCPRGTSQNGFPVICWNKRVPSPFARPPQPLYRGNKSRGAFRQRIFSVRVAAANLSVVDKDALLALFSDDASVATATVASGKRKVASEKHFRMSNSSVSAPRAVDTTLGASVVMRRCKSCCKVIFSCSSLWRNKCAVNQGGCSKRRMWQQQQRKQKQGREGVWARVIENWWRVGGDGASRDALALNKQKLRISHAEMSTDSDPDADTSTAAADTDTDTDRTGRYICRDR